MAKSHPARFDQHDNSQLGRWSRNAIAAFTLVTCLVSLNTILNARHGLHVGSLLGHGYATLDPAQLLNAAETPVQAPATDSVAGRKYRAVGEYLSRRYHVSSEMTTNAVAKAHTVGAELKIDPLLILAVIAVESRFNPLAESVMGAKGLMQIIPRFHADKFGPLGGENIAFDPQANIAVGASIFKEYLRRTGDVADALQLYVGASTEENENGYSAKVIAERDRLGQVLRQFESQRRTARNEPLRPLAAI
jgi:hypothetical protein